METIQKIDQVWKQYHETREHQYREQLILHYTELVKIIVSKLGIYQYHYLEVNDLTSYGMIGLIDAIERFEPAKEVKFETYASLRIRGHIIDNMRKVDWIPRTVRQKQIEMKKAMQQLEQTYHRTPTDTEIMTYLNLSEEEYIKIVKNQSMMDQVSMESVYSELEQTAEQKLVEQEIEEQETIEELAQAIRKLNEREQKILALYYYEELTFREIGTVLSISESRVSQIHCKIVLKLRGYLTGPQQLLQNRGMSV